MYHYGKNSKIPSEFKVTYFIMEFKLRILTIQRCEIENDGLQVYHGEFGNADDGFRPHHSQIERPVLQRYSRQELPNVRFEMESKAKDIFRSFIFDVQRCE